MYGPIANLPGYNPNATYLPPGVAAPSSYPERTAPTRKFYDMPQLPGVSAGVSSEDLYGQGGLASSDYPAGGGISGGIGGNAGGVDSLYGFQFPNNGSMDGLEYAFLNNFGASKTRPSDNARTLQPFDIQPNALTEADISNLGRMPDVQGWNFDNFVQSQQRPVQTTVSAQEDGQPIYSSQQTGYGQLPGYSQDYYQSQTPLQPFNIQPSGLNQSQLDQLGKLPSLPSQGSGSNWNTAMNLASLALPFPFGMAANALYGAAVGADGSHLTSDPSKGFLESMVSPSEPGLAAQAGNWLARQIAGEPKTQAELSAEQAYGSKSVYDPVSGMTQMASATPSIAQGSQDLGGTFGNGEWAGPWYGDSNPYWLTGNMLDTANWGPGTKYVMNANDTN